MSGRALRWMMSFAHRTPQPKVASLIIVRHHRVYADAESPIYRLGVGESVFAAQLELLRAIGLAPVTVAEGVRWLSGARSGRRVAMTFDDGYRDNLTRALPLLERHGAHATFYLAAGLIEERTAPWWDQLAWRLERAEMSQATFEIEGRRIRLELEEPAGRARAIAALEPLMRVTPELRQRRLESLRDLLHVRGEAPCELATWEEARALGGGGMEIGAHTLSHPHLSLLTPDRQDAEISGSIDLIERRLGVRSRGFAYPGGDYDASSVAIAARLELEHAVTTRRGDNGPDAPRLELRRRALSDGACLGPTGVFSRRLTLAELDGAFDWARGVEAAT